MSVLRHCFVFVCVVLLSGSAAGQTFKKFSHEVGKLGTQIKWIIYAHDSTMAVEYFRESEHLIDSMNAIFSDYDPNSEIRQFNNSAGPCRNASKPLMELAQISQDVAGISDGLFSVHLSSLTAFWRSVIRESAKWPSKRKVRRLLRQTDPGIITLDPDNLEICVERPVYFDFGGIAKGYIGDLLLDLARQRGIASIMIDLGGDIVLGDPPPGKSDWIIELPVSQAPVGLRNAAICSSGDQYQYFVHKGKRYSHIISPKSGYPVSESRSVTVIARNGTFADAFATVFCLADQVEIESMADEHHLAVWIISTHGDFINAKMQGYIQP